jgi:NitT/TauT family transport system substrate-binding protein
MKRLQLLRAGAAVAMLPSRAGAQTRPVIRVGVESGAETFSEPLYGVDAGMFARAGLDVQPAIFPAAGPIAAALAGGALDLGATDVILLANAVNRGVPLVAIAASGLFRTQEPTSGICVPRASALRSAKALEGGSIAVGTLVSLTSVAIRMWLTRNGADPAKVQFVEMKFAEMPAALARGNVTAAYITEPLLTRYADEVALIGTPYGTIAETFPISVITASRSWLAQNGDAAKRFAAALYETARWANTHRKETAAVLATFTKLEPEIIARMHRTQFATGFEPAMLQPILDAAAAYKLIERPTKAADLIAPGMTA